MTNPAPCPTIPQSELDALPLPAVNLARRAKQLKANGDGRNNRVTLEVIFLVDGSWLLTVDDSKRVEHLGKE